MKKLKLVLVGAIMAAMAVIQSPGQGTGSDVYWRIDRNVKSCSMVIDPSLTQAQWKTFVTQVGSIASFKSLAPAEPLGAMKFTVGIDRSSTPVDQHDLAWINTFVHPDENCPLGDAIAIPTLRAGMGITDDLDLGAFWTMAPNANYGMAGGEVKYRLSGESGQIPSVAVRGSFTMLTGVADFDLGIYSAEALASKKIAMFTPYIGIRENFAHAKVTTAKVNLDDENVLITQGYAGLSYSVWMLDLAAEYNISEVNTLALYIGAKF